MRPSTIRNEANKYKRYESRTSDLIYATNREINYLNNLSSLAGTTKKAMEGNLHNLKRDLEILYDSLTDTRYALYRLADDLQEELDRRERERRRREEQEREKKRKSKNP